VIAANELGVSYKLHPIELGKDNKADWYKAINPLGKVTNEHFNSNSMHNMKCILTTCT
jgi:Glutathione S-transferase, N-terminal domain